MSLLEIWEAAAKELWNENPELRSHYHFSFEAYLKYVRMMVEARQAWTNDPGLRERFMNSFDHYLAFRRATDRN